jgi:hypothetical protein
MERLACHPVWVRHPVKLLGSHILRVAPPWSVHLAASPRTILAV